MYKYIIYRRVLLFTPVIAYIYQLLTTVRVYAMIVDFY